jgi:hypothetical protein
MSDFREAVADRLERAADRMFNAGLPDEERRYSDAAARVRSGLSLEETRAIEQQMLSGQMPRLLNRLTALAAQGEYGGGGGGGGGGDGGSGAIDQPILTEIETGAAQLLSTAAASGLSDPFGSAQGGWILASQPSNSYTDLPAATSDYSGTQDADQPSDVAQNNDNQNDFTTGRNIDASSGVQDMESFRGGPPTPMLSRPDLVATNDVPNANSASDATSAGAVYLPVGTEQWAYGELVGTREFATFWRFNSPDGSMYALQSTNDGSVVIYNSSDNSVVGSLDRSGTFVSPSGAQQSDSVTTPQQTTTPTPAANPQTATPQLTPKQEAQLNAAIQQAVASSPPSPVDAGQPTNIKDVLAGTDWAPLASTQNQPPDQPGSPPAAPGSQPQTPSAPPGSDIVPFHPMADSPFTNWLLYGTDTPILDFLTSDKNLQIAQNVALGVAGTAATIATGGMLLEAAPGIIASTQAFFASAAAGAQSLSIAATPLAAGAAGLLATHPELQEEIESDLQSITPELESLGPQLDNALQTVEEEAAEEGTVLHHIFPQQFRDQFERLGIDIDKYTIRLDQITEHIPLHSGVEYSGVETEGWAGTYNDHWAVFLDQPGITAKDAFEFAAEFLNDLGLAGPEYPIVPYK